MTCYYDDTLPAFALNAYDAREAAEAACSTWISSVRSLDVLCGRADSVVAAPACDALSMAADGCQWLMVGVARAVGGHAATLGDAGVHLAVLLERSPWVPKRTLGLCNGRNGRV